MKTEVAMVSEWVEKLGMWKGVYGDEYAPHTQYLVSHPRMYLEVA
jgi:hypothetical protein